MAILSDSLTAAARRPLSLRARGDLVVRAQEYQGQRAWVVKDPLGLNYFRFRDEEYALLTMFDGRASLEEIRRKFEARFVPRRITVEEVSRFLGNLFQSGLVVADVPGQAEPLRRREETRRRQQWVSTLSSVLCIQLPVFDPDRLLGWLHRFVRWFFSPTVVAACLALMFSAVLLVAVEFDVFLQRLPSFHQFFARENWLYLALTLSAVKILHEFGHALTCKHFGGECHEMGLLLLVMTPCLYCNVTDSWLLKSKWQRAAVGAAGMYVELVLASIATLLWWNSAPGLLNQLCLSTMFISCVSTLIFNANPLLRYDGYYILSDLVEIPNLRQKASTALHRALGVCCLGLEFPQDPLMPQKRRGLFTTYAVAATLYGWIVLLVILWFVNKALEPYGLQVLGEALGLVAVVGMLAPPLWKLAKFLHVPGRIQQMNKRRLGITLGLSAAVAAAALFVPLPHRIIATVEVQPHDPANVYAEVPGLLERICVEPGERVAAGQLLAELSNVDVSLEEARLAGQEAELQAKLAALDRQRHQLDDAGEDARNQYPAMKESLENIRAQRRQRLRDVAQLKLVAPVSGTVMPPPLVSGDARSDGRLSTWSGTPLEQRNLGALVGQTAERALFCRIGDPRSLEAILVIDQADVELVREGQGVTIQLDQLPGERFTSTVDRVADERMEFSSSRLSTKTGGSLVTQTDKSGNERPMSASYKARALLTDEEGVLRIGLRGRASVTTAPQTLAARLWRYVCRTFQLDM